MRYCWAWRKHSLKTNKWTMFLEAEVAFPYCNWSVKMSRNIWFGSTYRSSISKQMEEVMSSSFMSLSKRNKQKTFSFISIKNINIYQKKIFKKLEQVWFASVLAPSSAVSCSPWLLLVSPWLIKYILKRIKSGILQNMLYSSHITCICIFKKQNSDN